MRAIFFIFLHSLQQAEGGLFSGPGSFYYFSNSSHYIGDRVIYDDETADMYFARDFMNELKVALRSSTAPPQLLQKSVNWLLIGDSTEQKLVEQFCDAMKRLSNKNKVALRHTNGGLQTHAHCTITISPTVKFQMANVFIFGYAEPTNVHQAETRIHPLLRQAAGYTAVRIVRDLLQRNSPFLLQTFGSATMPPLISMHSCLWDLNEHHGVHNKYYRPFLPISYYEGAKRVSHLISSLAPQSRLVISTCKPVNYMDTDENMNSRAGVTRSRDAQAALDAMIYKLMNHKDNVIHDMIDSARLLTGFEHYASDGRHYLSKAAYTMVNAYLNIFDRLLFKNDVEFLQSLNRVSVEPLVTNINSTYLFW